MRTFIRPLFWLTSAVLALLGGCASSPSPSRGPPARPEAVRAQIVALLPTSLPDRGGFAVDLYAAFGALGIEPSTDHVCQVLAVAEQESNYRADPAVPRLGTIAREELERRADKAGIPRLVLGSALAMRSPDSRSWAERMEAARTERELSDLFEDFIATVPFGSRLLAGYNPVRTGGPMQVSV